MSRVVVVGGGISGLSLAYRLQELLPSSEITLLEKNDRLGGKIATDDRDGFRLEAGPNGFLDNKPSVLSLCRRLGVDNDLIAASETAAKNRFLFLQGRLRLLPNSLWSFLKSDCLSASAKLALMMERFRPRRRTLDDESIDSFARRRVGSEVADTFADAFVTGIHAGDAKLLSVEATFPRIVAMERNFGSVTRGMADARAQRRKEDKNGTSPAKRASGQMWSFREGLGHLISTLKDRLLAKHLMGAAVRSIRRQHDGSWVIQAEGRDRWTADAVALTCPAFEQAALLADEDAILAEAINGIQYNRVAVVALGYRARHSAQPRRIRLSVATKSAPRCPGRAMVLIDFSRSGAEGHGAIAGDVRRLESWRNCRLVG